jgi:hypothetical protein
MIKEKIHNWFTRPRGFDNFVRWIIFNPKALSILMVMGHIVAVILFLLLAIASWIWFDTFMQIISLILLFLVFRTLYKYIKFQRKTGSIFESANVNDVVFGGKKK